MKKKTRPVNEKMVACQICKQVKHKKSMILIDHEVFACKNHLGVIKESVAFLNELIEKVKQHEDDSPPGGFTLHLLMQINACVSSLQDRVKRSPEADLVINEAKNCLISYSSFYSIK